MCNYFGRYIFICIFVSTKTNKMKYSEFISEVLKEVTNPPSIQDMHFSYTVGHQALGMNPAEAIELSTSL